MEIGYSVRAHYLDASALVKLVAEDSDEAGGRDVLRKYYREHSSRHATSYCVVEVFSAFKRKFERKQITKDEYVKYVHEFVHTVIGVNLEVEEVPVLSLVNEAERLINRHGIDFVDCIQIVTILQGKFKVFGPESKSILITADRELAKVARAEGARVWECTSEPAPA